MEKPSPVTLTPPSPLDAGALVFRSMYGLEALGRSFEYIIEATSDQNGIKADDVLGAPVGVTVNRIDGGERYFHGVLARFEYLGSGTGGGSSYRLVLRPWFWLLTRTADCRIFQNQSVVDILETVFQDFSFAEFDDSSLDKSKHPSREYTVQYRETDFHFLTRLMEEEGIYYYFKHEKDKHTLVLTDGPDEHTTPEGVDPFDLPFQGRGTDVGSILEYVSDWSSERQVEPAAFAHASFDFTNARMRLLARQSAAAGHPFDDLEVFDYTGHFVTQDAGRDGAGVQLEAHQQQAHASGRTNARSLAVGYQFTLQDHPRDPENGTYLVTSASYQIRGQSPESGSGGEEVMTAFFECIAQGQPFRCAHTAYKPRAGGPQTAVVVGPSSEEIWTDAYGRVKVQFHWDRLGKLDENSSCFVRVSQAWAGTGFGAIHIPRIGEEVVVDFLEGDPDRPIITGRVYNNVNMPPYDLPGNKTQSGFKSRSTQGGSLENFNAIRFEDLKGSEELFVQAEKDMNSTIKNNETRSVGADRSSSIGSNETLSVGVDRSSTIGSNETLKVGTNRTVTVGSDQSVTIGANHTVSVGANESVTIGANETFTIGANETHSVAASRTRTVGASETVTIAAAQSITAAVQTVTVGARTKTVATAEVASVGATLTLSVGAGRTTSIGGDDGVTVGGGQTVSIGGDNAISVGKNFSLEAADQITLKTGDASIVMGKGGDITIKGKDITVEGSGSITVKASSDLVLKGSKVSNN
ncbi:MAG TPA: type VI secretion system tip protein TssI/VgrG [Polyangiaceae bacterium]|jgi:type VI secretion system secreted protein VgrG|nr:type VI secretion system tip protein TssI/VgrG [Polyangiaceae bacterium]